MSRTRWFAVVCVALASGALILSGYGVAALVLLAAGSVIAIARRGDPVRRVRVARFEQVAKLPHSCDAVWALIEPAESAPIVQPSFRRGYHVPGTPRGLGERQAFESLDGTTTIFEIVEYEPGRRAVTTQVSPNLERPNRNVFALEPVEGGCELSRGLEVDVPARQRVNPDLDDAWRAAMRAEFDRIRQALAASDSGTAPENP